ncbi:conserved hypothetical protein [Vibrio phage 277E43-1]|nr:conserved hypothetical protein [Vibrio phage 277E43-1]
MNKVSCKYKNIYHEVKKRTENTEVVLSEEQDSLIGIVQGSSNLFNVCLEVLEALGYYTPPPLKAVLYEDYKRGVNTCFVKEEYLHDTSK